MGFLRSQMWKVLEWKDDSSDTIVYRFPMNGQEIMSGSQLTVRESQVAVFVDKGKVADVFLPGKYKLTTSNLPILSGIAGIFYQGESRFKAELYFVNTKQFVDRKWGTSNPVAMRDKEFGVIRIRAFGNYAFRVVDAKLFMTEVFGTRGQFSTDDIEGNFKNILVSQMTDTIAESGISALDMSLNYQEFGEMIKENARKKFNDLGLDITDFNVVNISFPEAVEKALDERTSLGILSDQMGMYTQKKTADAIADAAKTQGGATSSVIGMGLGGVVNGCMANQQANAQPQPKSADEKFCPECGSKIKATAKFCPECGTKLASASVCAKCGATLTPGAKFCPECGEKV